MLSINFDILKIKKNVYFLIIFVLTALVSYFVQLFFFKDTIVYNTYAEQLTYDRITTILASQKKYQWLGYIFLPVALYIKVLYNSFWVTTGSLLSNERGYFISNFNVCLKAEHVFVIMLVVKFIFFIFFKQVNTLNDLSFIPGSLSNFFSFDSIPKWLLYPIQTINIWEIFYCMSGTSLYAIQFDISKIKAAKLFCIPYLIGLFIWMLVVVFITLQLT